MAVTLVQSVAGTNSFGGSTPHSTLTGTTAGNLILAMVQWQVNTGGTTRTLSSISDGTNGTYTLIAGSLETASSTNEAQIAVQFAYAKNIAGGNVTVTGNLSGSVNGGFVTLWELSGYDTTTPIDQVSINTATITSQTSLTAGTVTTNRNGEFGAVGALFDDGLGGGSIYSVGAGFTALTQNTGGGNTDQGAEYINQSTAGSLSGVLDFASHSGTYVAAIVTVQPPSSGTPTPELLLLGCGSL